MTFRSNEELDVRWSNVWKYCSSSGGIDSSMAMNAWVTGRSFKFGWYSHASAFLLRLGCNILVQAAAEAANSSPKTISLASISLSSKLSSKVPHIMLTFESCSKSKVKERSLGKDRKAASQADVLSLTYFSSLYLSSNEVKRITR